MSGMVFKNYGGIYQLRMDEPEDLPGIQKLDLARWAATSAPADSFQCDPVFLAYLDPAKGGRIRPAHLREAQRWLFHVLANRARITSGTDILRLADLDTGHAEGRELKHAAERILVQTKAENREEISLARVREFQKGYAATFPNGDGIVPLEFVEDSETRAFAGEVVTFTGGTKDASGKTGYAKEHLEAFLARARKIVEWRAKGAAREAGPEREAFLPWGKETPAAAARVAELDKKIEQFFWQCDLVRLDERAAERMRLQALELSRLDINDPAKIEARLAEAPLAPPDPSGVLALSSSGEGQETGASLNPLYAARLEKLRREVLERALGGGAACAQLTRASWRRVRALFAPYLAWKSQAPNDEMEKLEDAQLAAYLEGPLPGRARALIEQDLAVAQDLRQLHNVEKLLLYQRWLVELANNFVSFPRLYDPSKRALFELGTLILDGRALAFTTKVNDRAAHKKAAAASSMFLVYAEVTGKDSAAAKKFEIVAAVTAGTVGGIAAGKRGLFIANDGSEWDARVVDVLANPISLWEAVKAPFQKAKELLAKKAEHFASAQVETLEKTADKGLPGAAAPPAPKKAGPPPPPPPGGGSNMRDIVLAGGLAFAALGSALAFIVKTISERPLHVAAALLGLIVVVAVCSALLGWAKLRRRDMSAVLEAGGWALNFRMNLTRRLGRLFTRRAKLPEGARRERRDLLAAFLTQVEERSFRVRRVLLGLLLGLLLLAAALYLYFPAGVTGWWNDWFA